MVEQETLSALMIFKGERTLASITNRIFSVKSLSLELPIGKYSILGQHVTVIHSLGLDWFTLKEDQLDHQAFICLDTLSQPLGDLDTLNENQILGIYLLGEEEGYVVKQDSICLKSLSGHCRPLPIPRMLIHSIQSIWMVDTDRMLIGLQENTLIYYHHTLVWRLSLEQPFQCFSLFDDACLVKTNEWSFIQHGEIVQRYPGSVGYIDHGSCQLYAGDTLETCIAYSFPNVFQHPMQTRALSIAASELRLAQEGLAARQSELIYFDASWNLSAQH